MSTSRTSRRSPLPKTLVGLAEELGLRIVRHREEGDVPLAYHGDGTITIEKKFSRPAVKAIAIAHEVAHFLVATPEQRKLDNFGLGSPSWDQSSTKCVVPNSEDVEDQACVLDAALLDYYGYLKPEQRLSDVGLWGDHDDFGRALKALQRRKLIEHQFLRFVPTPRL